MVSCHNTKMTNSSNIRMAIIHIPNPYLILNSLSNIKPNTLPYSPLIISLSCSIMLILCSSEIIIIRIWVIYKWINPNNNNLSNSNNHPHKYLALHYHNRLIVNKMYHHKLNNNSQIRKSKIRTKSNSILIINKNSILIINKNSILIINNKSILIINKNSIFIINNKSMLIINSKIINNRIIIISMSNI